MSTEDDDLPLDSVDEQAADWVVRQDGEGLSESEQQELAKWLARPDHRSAYDRHRALWGEYKQAGGRGAVLGGTRRRGRRAPEARLTVRPRQAAAAAIAATMVLVAIGYADDWPLRLRADHVTGFGERRTVALEDGSTVQLDARSAVAFDKTGRARRLRLLAGSAAIQVAPDPDRPLTVVTDAGRVTALGTAFALRSTQGGMELTVTEHKVSVETEDGAKSIVQEGEGTVFEAGRIAAPRKVDVRAATGWTRGKLFVSDQPLAEVVSTIGKRRFGYWTVRGDAANIRVDGVYDLDNPLAALGVLERSLHLKSLRLSDRVIILSR